MTGLLNVNPEGLLECPKCHEVFGTHVDGVIMADDNGQGLLLLPPGEDSPDSGVIPVMGVKVDRRFTSARRHSAVLVIWCELCATHSRVGFIQHKGQTITKVMTHD